MRKIAILIAILIGCGVEGFAQGKVSRSKTQTTTAKQTKKQTQKAKPLIGEINGHEWVDLGLPSGTKWATCNVGASSPEEYGDFFAWGETSTKSSYDRDNSLTYGKSISTLKSEEIIDSRGILNKRYDTANANWESTWRMPTETECDELISKCKWEWTTQRGKEGYRVIGSNGNSIFLPAAGYRYSSSLFSAVESGNYWSSSVGNDGNYAYYLCFDSGDHSSDWYGRGHGRSVRPVSE